MPEYAAYNRTITQVMSVDFEASSPDEALAKARAHTITEADYQMESNEPFVEP